MRDSTNTHCTEPGCDARVMDMDGHCGRHALPAADPLGPHIDTANPDGSVTRTQPDGTTETFPPGVTPPASTAAPKAKSKKG